MSTVLLDTTDLTEAVNGICAAYERVQLFRQPGSELGRTRISRTTLGSLAVDEIQLGCELGFRSNPPDRIYLARMRSGTFVYEWMKHRQLIFGPDDVAAYDGSEGGPFTGWVARTHCDVLSIDRCALNEVATGPGDAPVRLTGLVPVSQESKRHLLGVADYVCRSVSDDLQVVSEPLISSTIRRYLAASMLAAFPSTAVLDTTVQDRRDSTPQLLRQAIAFIDDNAHADISLTDIANAIFVTPRALQYMFRNHRDCTPTEYLRQVRLHHAHLELVAGNRYTTSVGEIARNWGFGHMGRFAAYYRQHYGKSPHVTLLE
ncbi:helix-turn-helix transcriptional regulator [Mycobacterium camsae]|uniref:helix-turn-helix transcriptional regulator n=1 Tax=Mycobacterium gordonae TaxID=1778 RepID=UPI00197F18D1|nr:helix-turn-helix transcriptional regulator [Mycobacterium gordonae]